MDTRLRIIEIVLSKDVISLIISSADFFLFKKKNLFFYLKHKPEWSMYKFIKIKHVF